MPLYQADRQRSLRLIARQLREARFQQMMPASLKDKHVQAGSLAQRRFVRWHTQEPAFSPALVSREDRQGRHPACG
jgi:hypothetical protein